MKRGMEARRKRSEASARLPGHITYNASLYAHTENRLCTSHLKGLSHELDWAFNDINIQRLPVRAQRESQGGGGDRTGRICISHFKKGLSKNLVF
jgi:hypothetical protein